MTRRRWTAAPSLLLAALTAGCGALPAALDPAGPQAARVAVLWWWFLGVCAVVYLLVVGALAWAAWRGRRRGARRGSPQSAAPPAWADDPPELSADPARERRLALAVAGAAGATVLILIGLLVGSVITGDALAGARPEAELTIHITGRQWWWEVEYPGEMASERVITANEIHLPVGAIVHLEMTSADVIHSFWVPRLHGKIDLVPGRTTHHWLAAERPGVFTGQCAEFCGHQHAHMGLLVVAEPPERFAAWLAAQRRSAAAPDTAAEARGLEVFLDSSCVLCHAIRGTPAGGRTAPDLTHVASRATLAAGTLANTPGHLGGWILDSQGVKPGNRMPPNALSGEELQALLAYLESLR
ncbi:MAG TPA: cytochrome c oxidase subunit II [Thermoanaerobaculia bacterium]|nr:cytochrome c oxidase subunit II [Thermoanaerobaculia bacterium]